MSRKEKAKKVARKRIVVHKKITSQVVKKPADETKVGIVTRTQLQSQTLVTNQTKQDLLKSILIVLSIFALEFAVFYATLK